MYFVTDHLCIQVKLGGKKKKTPILKDKSSNPRPSELLFCEKMETMAYQPWVWSSFSPAFGLVLVWLLIPDDTWQPFCPRETRDDTIQSFVYEFGKFEAKQNNFQHLWISCFFQKQPTEWYWPLNLYVRVWNRILERECELNLLHCQVEVRCFEHSRAAQ